MKLASVDSAWLNATFALIALSLNLQTSPDRKVSTDALFYRGQALRLVNERLAKSPPVVDDTTIGAVTTLCNFDIMSGSLVSATAHMTGLGQIVKLRGGIDSLPSEQKFLLRLISWCDMGFASIWGGRPRFPELKSLSPSITPPTGPFETLPYHKGDLSEQIVPNNMQVDLCTIGQRIYVLSVLMDSLNTNDGDASTEDKEFFAQTLYSTQHHLLHLLSSLRLAASPGFDTSFIRRSHGIASSLYINLALRELAPRAEMNYVLVRRLKLVLEEAVSEWNEANGPLGDPVSRLVEIWEREDRLDKLLWISFVGRAGADEMEEKDWFMRILEFLGTKLGLTSLEEFQGVIKRFGWVAKWAEPHARSVWEDMEMQTQMRRMEVMMETDAPFELYDERELPMVLGS
jgi:hypothetical protein